MMAPGHEIAIRALGSALAGLSMAFAIYMLAYGGGKARIYGMEHLAIFAQPRGSGGAVGGPLRPAPEASPAVDMSATGSLAAPASKPTPNPRPVEIVAAQAGRVWLSIDGAIHPARRHDRGPGEDRGDRPPRRRLGPHRRQGQRASVRRQRGEWRRAVRPRPDLRIARDRAGGSPIGPRIHLFRFHV